jgi:hypothetical protein
MEARILVITFDASVDGWGAVIRSSPDERGTEIVGGYRLAAPILGRAFVDPAALPACPTWQVYRETLAGFLATKAASQLHALADRTVLIRSDCTGAISALRKGSIRASASTPALREKVVAEAERWLGAPLSLDLFATADNALVPLFFSRFPEPLAEGIDALAQPDWGRSRCPHCPGPLSTDRGPGSAGARADDPLWLRSRPLIDRPGPRFSWGPC